MSTPGTGKWEVIMKIGGTEVSSTAVQKFEWKSMVNGGFIVRARIIDAYFNFLGKIIEVGGSNEYLKTGRQRKNLTLIEFQIKWEGGDGQQETPKRLALITDLHAVGNSDASGLFEFIAVDPISYFLNAGDASGKVYKGKIGGSNGVIDQVIKEYTKDLPQGMSVTTDIGDTTDQEAQYWQMRQDPKSFIMSLLEWSSKTTKNKTYWIVANGQEGKSDTKKLKIEVKEGFNPSLKAPGGGDPLVFRYGGAQGQSIADILNWEFLADSFISAMNTKLVTSGMSAMSGEYFDRITDKDDEKTVFVKDENTDKKTNVNIDSKQGFSKPIENKFGWTSVHMVPEFSDGAIGLKYDEYIDGRARQQYMNMLNLLMRVRVTVRGEPRLFDSTELGRSKAKLKWLKADNSGGGSQERFLDGDWLIYGWHHKCVGSVWSTDVYMSRLDYDAAASKG